MAAMKRALAAALLVVLICCACRAPQKPPEELARTIPDPEIRAGVEAAVFKNILPAAT